MTFPVHLRWYNYCFIVGAMQELDLDSFDFNVGFVLDFHLYEHTHQCTPREALLQTGKKSESSLSMCQPEQKQTEIEQSLPPPTFLLIIYMLMSF